MKSCRLISRNKVNIENILNEWFSSKVYSEDGIYIKRIQDESRRITIFIAEDYYLRINSTLSLTVIVEETADKKAVEIISSGGKAALFSWGSENSAVKRVVKLLKENGFEEIQ